MDRILNYIALTKKHNLVDHLLLVQPPILKVDEISKCLLKTCIYLDEDSHESDYYGKSGLFYDDMDVLETVIVLLLYGADAGVMDKHMNTSLHHVFKNCTNLNNKICFRVSKCIIESCPSTLDIFQKNKDGESVVNLYIDLKTKTTLLPIENGGHDWNYFEKCLVLDHLFSIHLLIFVS